MFGNRFVQLMCAVAALVLAASLVAEAQRTRATSASAVPAGSEIYVRITDHLTSAKARAGQTFSGALEQPIVSGSTVVFPKGAEVSGRVLEVEKSGRLHDPGVLVLTLTEVRHNGRVAPLHVESFRIKGESHAKNNVVKIGGGAAAGAIIGGIAGGGKGAAIGAGVGAAAGTGVAAATGKKEAEVESEAILVWQTTQRAAVQQTTQQASSAYRQSPANPAGGSAAQAPGQQHVQSGNGPEGNGREFGRRDREYIRGCFVENRGNLPPGLAKRDRLPPGLERQVRKNGQLPPGLQKRVHPLPEMCSVRLPRLPRDWERVVLGGRVLLLSDARVIVDLFDLGGKN